ncbi:hypothetical protein CDD81_2323 [Ophiocordyceps australis]|uniref:Cyanovirin-N domain-containing protein n=1 Tax=Ophiocordyceps australis TaxID=1399860 RepID=A0A2C5XZ34_9HYPO|nr:hypothetical protein CDD81_2323 [Ophiocordyceps australis]
MFLAKLLVSLVLAATAASTVPGESIPDGHCCFSLADESSSKTLQQEFGTGFIYFDTKNPNTPYTKFCLKPGAYNKALRDQTQNACQFEYGLQLQCIGPMTDFMQWSITKREGKQRLAVDGNTGFRACPLDQGGWGVFHVNGIRYGDDCRNMTLLAKEFRGACHGIVSD